ncbi:MAG: cobalt-precorrin-5B (C(1))-methyltransferase, partial [Thiothrix nivea]
DVARANGLQHIAASTGNTSEQFIARHYHLPEMALIEMGDFAGAVLKYLKRHPVQKLSICGGFGKLSKLAQGHLDLHSRASTIDFNWLAGQAQRQGGKDALCRAVTNANTSLEAQQYALDQGIDLVQPVCQAALTQVQKILPDTVQAEIWAVNRQGECLGMARSEPRSL